MRSGTVAVGCQRLRIGLFEPIPWTSLLRPVATGCARSASIDAPCLAALTLMNRGIHAGAICSARDGSSRCRPAPHRFASDVRACDAGHRRSQCARPVRGDRLGPRQRRVLVASRAVHEPRRELDRRRVTAAVLNEVLERRQRERWSVLAQYALFEFVGTARLVWTGLLELAGSFRMASSTTGRSRLAPRRCATRLVSPRRWTKCSRALTAANSCTA